MQISKEEIPGSKSSMYGYMLTCPGLKGRTCELWVLDGWVFNFCVRSTPLRGLRAEKSSTNQNQSLIHYLFHASLAVGKKKEVQMKLNEERKPRLERRTCWLEVKPVLAYSSTERES